MLVRLFGRSLTFARDVPIQGILWGLILGVGMLQADTGVVIGSFTNVQNAQSLKKQSWNLELSLPLQDIRVITNQEGPRALHRVVLIPSQSGQARNLLPMVRAAGFESAWVVQLPASQLVFASASPPDIESTNASSPDTLATAAKTTDARKPVVTLASKGANTPKATREPSKLLSRLGNNTSVTFRLKGFGSASQVPSSDLSRAAQGDNSTNSTLDLRTMLQHDSGAWSVEMAHTLLIQHGDQLGPTLAASGLNPVVVSDDRRLMDLTFDLNDGQRHQALHRLDRLNAQWRSDQWSVTLGRQAVSWGSGIVFQPLDPFNPFAPTAVDRDYKAGDDLVLIERLFENGHDMQLMRVFRRDAADQVSNSAASTAAKWHGYAGPLEFELIAAQHYGRDFFGVSGRVPLGPAVLRSDIAIREGVSAGTQNSQWGTLGIVNVDVAFPWRGRTIYAFAEYFHNDFGLSDLSSPLTQLPADLQVGLERGEFFNLMRDYLALGGSLEWHPLLTQQLTLITNLHDASSLVQMQLAWDVAQNQNVQLGWVGFTGGGGDEFAPVSIGALPTDQTLTQGGGDRVYLRWAGYF